MHPGADQLVDAPLERSPCLEPEILLELIAKLPGDQATQLLHRGQQLGGDRSVGEPPQDSSQLVVYVERQSVVDCPNATPAGM